MLSSRGWGEEKTGRKRIKERGEERDEGGRHNPHPSPPLSLHSHPGLLGPSSRGQTPPAGACSQGRSQAVPGRKNSESSLSHFFSFRKCGCNRG